MPQHLLTVEKPTDEDNSQTIRPLWTSHRYTTISEGSASDDHPYVEDYSDVAREDEDMQIKARVAEFKVFIPLRWGCCCVTQTYIMQWRRGT